MAETLGKPHIQHAISKATRDLSEVFNTAGRESMIGLPQLHHGGYLLPCESRQRLVEEISTGDELTVDVEKGTLTNQSTGKSYQLEPAGDVKPIIEAGGVFGYARQAGMLDD